MNDQSVAPDETTAELIPLEALEPLNDDDLFLPAVPTHLLRDRLLVYANLVIAASTDRTDEAELGRLHYQLARTHAALQNYAAAKSHGEAANYFFEVTQQTVQQARSLLLLAQLQDELGDDSGALWTFERVAELAEQLDDRILQARAFEGLAQILEHRGELEKALKRYRQAEKLLGLEDASGESEAVRLLRSEIISSIAFVQAELVIRQALELAERVSMPEMSAPDPGAIEPPPSGNLPRSQFPGTEVEASRPSKSFPPRHRRRW